jgi:hypothetical protein
VSIGTMDENKLKDVLKAAIVEVLEESSDLLEEMIEEALADLGLARAIAVEENSPTVSREQVFKVLEGKR